jgi:hypothetical protein
VQRYPVRASHRPNLQPQALEAAARTHFGEALLEGPKITAKFGAISRLVAQAEGRELGIELSMDPKVPEEIARETIARYNRFLEDVTGYNSKERARRLRKDAAG